MSKETKIIRCKGLSQQLLLINIDEIELQAGGMSEYDGLDFPELRKTFRFVQEMFLGLQANDAWGDVTWHAVNSLDGLIQNCISLYHQFKNARDQNSFQNLGQNVDSLAYHLRLFGVPSLAASSVGIEKASAKFQAELDHLVDARRDIEKLRLEVKNLITPGVAGSLSQAFTARKNILLYGRIAWGVIALLIGSYCIHATFGFASAVSDALVSSKPTNGQDNFVWFSVLIRSVILLPLYAAFGFSFAQYKKERDFEEEYAHKAAVAASLPNYGDLTREPAVRDQIVTGATNVIFSSPTAKQIESDKQEKVLGGVKEIFDSVSKLISKKD